ncbi:MAG: ferric reductase-like transmembrane domain-containing protein [Thermoleophilia bacterium]
MSAHAYWYLTRGSGVTVLLLLTASLVLGIASTLRVGGRRTPRFVTSGLHRNISLLSLAFLAVHVLTTLADGYAPIRLLDAVVPFASPYRPVWLGLGAVALDLLVALAVTSLLRVRIGLRTWRGLHWAAYAVWPVAMLHALGTGTDAPRGWMVLVAAGCLAVVGAAVAWRLARAGAEHRPLRLGLGLASVAVPVLAVAWFASGPLQPGWAARAGTPATLLGGGGTTAARAATGLPGTGFSAPATGTLVESAQDATGEITVRVDAVTSGDVRTTVRVALHGPALPGGGVAMRVSRATFGPVTDPARYTGEVSALDGRHIAMTVRAPGHRPEAYRITIDLQDVDLLAGTVHGTLVAQPVRTA